MAAVEDFTLNRWHHFVVYFTQLAIFPRPDLQFSVQHFVFSTLSHSILLQVFQAGSCFIFFTHIFLLSDNKIAASSRSPS